MELFDVVNEQGIPTGDIVSREKAHTEGICHRTAQIWVVRFNGNREQVLLQKRLATKESHPNCYDTSAAGHITAGDEPLESALRELEEELGIHAEAGDLEFQGTHRVNYGRTFHGRLFRDNEVGFVYVYDRPVDIDRLRVQPEEVDSVRWFDLEELAEKVETRSPDCCVTPGGMRLLLQWFEKKRTGV